MRAGTLGRMALPFVISGLGLAGTAGLASARPDDQAGEQSKDKKQEEKDKKHEDKKKQQEDKKKREDPKAPAANRKHEPQATRQEQRLSQARQQQLIQEQRARLAQYRQQLAEQNRLAQQRAQALQQQKRLAQHRFQQRYLERMRQQQARLDEARNYEQDPYFYTPPSYRYSRAGRYYETNQYGVDQLRQAVNYGYQEGFLAGQADRQDRWNGGYRDSYAYLDANYGYNGYYVDQDTYQYYFREGFQRGYEDGFNSRSQYGTVANANGTAGILATVLTQILNLQSLR